MNIFNMRRMFSLMLIICLLLITAIGCQNKLDIKDTTKSFNLYFANNDKNNLLVETRDLDVDEDDNIYSVVMEALLDGPVSSNLSAVIPKGTKLESVFKNGETLHVDLSPEYYDANSSTELLARYSIVNTLCDLEGIKKVLILIDGKSLLNSSFTPVGELGSDDIMINPTIDTTEKARNIKLYFSDANAQYLIPETRHVNVLDNNESKTIVTELIKGSVNTKLANSIPSDTKLISAEITQGICFVNLSKEFISKSVGSAQEQMAVYSIVNSLTELEKIDSVQFLIEGKKVETYGDMIFDEPFERNDTIIKR